MSKFRSHFILCLTVVLTATAFSKNRCSDSAVKSFIESYFKRADKLDELKGRYKEYPCILDEIQEISLYRKILKEHSQIKKKVEEMIQGGRFVDEVLTDKSLLNRYGLSNEDIYQQSFLDCAMSSPLKKTRRKCYAKLKEIIIFSYSGSAGVNLPPVEKYLLRTLPEKYLF